jgi:RNA polymerase sigma-70 factor (ECF subfamily)
MTNDIILFAKIKGGDIKVFESVFRLYYTPLCLYAAGITGRKDVSEEIVQELFYIFWREREKLHVLHSLRSYLFRSVRNSALRYCEHREVMERHRETTLAAEDNAGQASSPQEVLEYKELETLVRRALQKLPERRLRIFRMHRVEGKKYTEIASELSLSVKTVEAEMTKALRTLRKEIENYTHIA